jgi:hypothetical protein
MAQDVTSTGARGVKTIGGDAEVERESPLKLRWKELGSAWELLDVGHMEPAVPLEEPVGRVLGHVSPRGDQWVPSIKCDYIAVASGEIELPRVATAGKAKEAVERFILTEQILEPGEDDFEGEDEGDAPGLIFRSLPVDPLDD